MPEISDAEYKKFLADQAELETAKNKISKLETTAENTKEALKKHRDTEKDLKEKISTLEGENADFKKDVEEKYKDFDDLSEKAKKFDEQNEKIANDRKANIDSMKEKLKDKLTDDDNEILDGLEDSKAEKYLTKLMPKDDGDKKKTPNLKTGDDWNKKTPEYNSFEEAKEKWSVDDMISAMDNPTDSGED